MISTFMFDCTSSLVPPGILYASVLASLMSGFTPAPWHTSQQPLWPPPVRRLQRSPSPNLFKELMKQSQQKLAQFDPQSLANLVWALGKLEKAPGRAWVSDMMAVTKERMAAFDMQQLAQVRCCGTIPTG